jgi:hypothetical protein
MTEYDFEDQRDLGLRTDVAYKVGGAFGFSPDGEGVIWYPTMAALTAAHGTGE